MAHADAPDRRAARTGAGRRDLVRGRALRGRTHRLQRHDRPATRGDRSGRERRRRDGRRELRARGRAGSRRPWRRAQRAGVRDLRRRRRDRPVGDARRARGPGELDGAGRGRGDLGRLQRGDPCVRSGDDRRHHLDDRGRGPHARRRDRLPRTGVRPVDRQPRVRGRRDRGRAAGPGERAGARRPVLGAPGRRRELRRGDLAGVPAASGEGDLRRSDVLRAERGRERAAVLPRVHRRRARTDGRVPRVPDRAAAPVHPGGPARRHVHRDRGLLGGAGRGGPEGVRAVPRRRAGGGRVRRPDAVPGAERRVRRAVAARAAPLLEGEPS